MHCALHSVSANVCTQISYYVSVSKKKYYYDGDVWNKASRTSPAKIVTMTGLVQKLKTDANFDNPVT